MKAPSRSPRMVASLSARVTAALFHSTPRLDRQRRSRFRFWNSEDDYFQGSSSDRSSWFEKQSLSKGRKGFNFWNEESHWTNNCHKRKEPIKSFWSNNNGDEFDTIFGSAFGGHQYFYWSVESEIFYGNSSTDRKCYTSWYQKDESKNEDNVPRNSDWTSDRLELGLTTTGPLKLEEVKSAYHACALRWHPDRHQGSSKIAAEEKFKRCTAAYRVLCDGLIRD